MSNTGAALTLLGAFSVLVVSLGMTYAVYQYGNVSYTEQTHITDEEVGVDGA